MPDRLNALPTFCCIDDSDKVNLWPPTPQLTYGEANALGRDRATELVDILRRTRSPVLLGHVVEAIVKAGEIGGIEIGFFHALSLELLTPAVIQEFVEIPPERSFHSTRQKGHLHLVGGANAA